MKLARSTYYYRSRRSTVEKVALRKRIETLCAEFPRDGYRRITHHLRAEGTLVNHKAVARLMRQNNLQVRPLRKFVRTTDSNHDGPIFPNLAGDASYRAQSSVGGRYHVHPHRVRLCLSGRDAGWLVPPRDWLRAWSADRYPAYLGSVACGDRDPPAPARLHPSF